MYYVNQTLTTARLALLGKLLTADCEFVHPVRWCLQELGVYDSSYSGRLSAGSLVYSRATVLKKRSTRSYSYSNNI